MVWIGLVYKMEKAINLFNEIMILGEPLRLGISYMGSKRAITKEVFQAMFNTVGDFDSFYDLFGGGGAMTFAALELGIKNVHYNELNTGVANLMLFLRDNKIPDSWYDFVDREKFFEHNSGDDAYSGMVKTVYSFGNRGDTYLYGKDIEQYKQWTHELIVNKCPDAKKELENYFNIKIPDFEGSLHERRLQWYSVLRTTKHTFNEKQIQLERIKSLEEIRELAEPQNEETLDGLVGIQHLTQLESIRKIEENRKKLVITNESYERVKIAPNSVVYCDIPYENTGEYQTGGFDHRFFEIWFSNVDFPVFVSSYSFSVGYNVMNLEKRVLLQGGGDNYAIERLYWNGVKLKNDR